MKRMLIIFMILGISVFAQNPNLGTSGAKFLQIPIGARATSIGGACAGMINDASAAFWNPAGLAKINSSAVHFSYLKWFDMFDVNAISVVHNFGEVGVVAASLLSFNMDKMEITTEDKPNGTGGFFDAQDITIGLSYSRFLTDKFSVGLTLKYVNQRLWNESASGIAFDIGTQYLLDFQNLTLAMTMSNFGSDMRYDGSDLNVTYDKSKTLPLNRLTPAKLVTDDYPLPLSFQVGIGIDLFNSDIMKIRLGLDAVHPNDNVERINTGAEFSFLNKIFLRVGYKFNYDDEDLNFGAGVILPIGETNINFDYAFSVYHILPSVHRISIGLEF
jgi:hypothetical protein